MGIIRQICDDFDDYFNFHHEPFGDFISSNNRLPELLFKKNNGNRLQVLELLQKNDLKKARDLVLNDKVRYELYQFCKKELDFCKSIKTNFNYEKLIEDFEKILTKNKKQFNIIYYFLMYIYIYTSKNYFLFSKNFLTSFKVKLISPSFSTSLYNSYKSNFSAKLIRNIIYLPEST